MEGDMILKECCGAAFGHRAGCPNYRPPHDNPTDFAEHHYRCGKQAGRQEMLLEMIEKDPALLTKALAALTEEQKNELRNLPAQN